MAPLLGGAVVPWSRGVQPSGPRRIWPRNPRLRPGSERLEGGGREKSVLPIDSGPPRVHCRTPSCAPDPLVADRLDARDAPHTCGRPDASRSDEPHFQLHRSRPAPIGVGHPQPGTQQVASLPRERDRPRPIPIRTPLRRPRVTRIAGSAANVIRARPSPHRPDDAHRRLRCSRRRARSRREDCVESEAREPSGSRVNRSTREGTSPCAPSATRLERPAVQGSST